MLRIASQTVILPTAAATNCTGPSGGVLRPIPRLRIMITPKCTGSMPKLLAIGRKMGVVMMISGPISMKVPSTSSSTLIISSTSSGSLEIAAMPSVRMMATLR